MRVTIDGVATPPAEAKLSVFDRGLLFGDAIYEVISTHRRRPFELAAHLDRLEASGRAIGIDVAALRPDLEREVAALVADAPGEGELYVRIMITGGVSADMDLAGGDGPPVRIVLVKPLTPWEPRVLEEGLRLKSVQPEEVVGRIAPWVKSNNRQANIMAHRLARQAGCDDGLFVDPEGHVTEGPTWNVFCVRDGAVRTPALVGGLLPGITRSVILELCRQEGIPLSEGTISLEEARACDELFITSTTRGVMSVRALDDARFAAPGPVTQRLVEALRRRMEESA